MTIQLPQIDVLGLAPVIGLVLIALAALVVIVVVLALRSKVAVVIALVVGAAVIAPVIGPVVSVIVGAIVPLALILVAGLITLAVLIARNPDLADVVRDLKPQSRITTLPNPPMMIDQADVKQLPAASAATVKVRRSIDQASMKDWGF
jgi:hypothetical protein